MLLFGAYVLYTDYPSFDVVLNVYVPLSPTTEAILGYFNRSFVIFLDLDAFVDWGCHEFFHLS